MTEENKEPALSPKDKYIELLLNPDAPKMTRDQIAEACGCSRRSLWRWDKEIDFEWIKAERRKAFARVVLEVDDALIKKAKGGDVRAMELVYQRFDGWVPTSRQISEKTDSAIEEELQKIEAERARQQQSGLQ